MFYSVLALLFIIRLRFPKDVSVADIIRRRYGAPVLHLDRKYEKHLYKLEKLKCDASFLDTCIKHGLTPNFLRFKVYNDGLRRSRLYRNCQSMFLRNELQSKQRGINSVNNEVSAIRNQLKPSVSWLDFSHLDSLAKKANHSKTERARYVQYKKLRNLGYVSDNGVAHDEVIFNFSDRIFSDIEMSALAKGLRFSFFLWET